MGVLPKGKKKEGPKELRAVRLAPEEFVFPLTMYIYDNKVSLMSTKRENFGLIIESQEFMQTQKAMFDVLWQASSLASYEIGREKNNK